MEDAVKSFLDYTSNFLENEDYNIKLKIDHTFRVMNLCEKIANGLNMGAFLLLVPRKKRSKVILIKG